MDVVREAGADEEGRNSGADDGLLWRRQARVHGFANAPRTERLVARLSPWRDNQTLQTQPGEGLQEVRPPGIQ